jgi:hypothetical protein
MRPLERSSLEAYGFGLITIISASVPMTSGLRAALMLIGIGLVADIVWRSRWTISLHHHHKALILGGIIGVVVLVWFISRSPAQAPVPPAQTSHVMPAPGSTLPAVAGSAPTTAPPRKARVHSVKADDAKATSAPGPPPVFNDAPGGIANSGTIGTVVTTPTNPCLPNLKLSGSIDTTIIGNVLPACRAIMEGTGNEHTTFSNNLIIDLPPGLPVVVLSLSPGDTNTPNVPFKDDIISTVLLSVLGDSPAIGIAVRSDSLANLEFAPTAPGKKMDGMGPITGNDGTMYYKLSDVHRGQYSVKVHLNKVSTFTAVQVSGQTAGRRRSVSLR